MYGLEMNEPAGSYLARGTDATLAWRESPKFSFLAAKSCSHPHQSVTSFIHSGHGVFRLIAVLELEAFCRLHHHPTIVHAHSNIAIAHQPPVPPEKSPCP